MDWLARMSSSFLVGILQAARSKNEIRADLDINEFSLMVWGMSVGMVQLINTKANIIQMYLPHSSAEFYAHYADLIIQGIRK
ncbi:MAG: hypothetical protein AAFV80_16810 [Bacteroidota bacterium]